MTLGICNQLQDVCSAEACGSVKWPVLDTVIIKNIFYDRPSMALNIALVVGDTRIPLSMEVC